MRDLTGQTFGRLTVIRRAVSREGHSCWLCWCSCNKTKTILQTHLVTGESQSCGCRNKEAASKRFWRHGKTGSLEYMLWKGAKMRARRDGLLFTLNVNDIVIPKCCPVLGIKIQKVKGSLDSSPSLDRWRNDLGYTPENVAVISYRANRIKNDATLLELRAIVRYAETGGLNGGC